MLSRRELLKRLGVGSLAAGLPGVMFANAQTENRLVVFILRGAMDGMAMLAPYGDGNYAGLRGKLALAAPGQEGGVLKVDGLFGIHPALQHTHELYQQKQALFVHAVASGYRERSHFDGQDQLESGSSEGNFKRDGWLNRACRLQTCTKVVIYTRQLIFAVSLRVCWRGTCSYRKTSLSKVYFPMKNRFRWLRIC